MSTRSVWTENGEIYALSLIHILYSLDVVEIPTNKPMIRKDMDDLVYKTEPAKFNAVIDLSLIHISLL